MGKRIQSSLCSSYSTSWLYIKLCVSYGHVASNLTSNTRRVFLEVHLHCGWLV